MIDGRGVYRDGKKEGTFERLDDRGRLRAKQSYKADLQDGLEITYEPNDPNGLTETTWVAGKRHGPTRSVLAGTETKGRYDQNKRSGLWVRTTPHGRSEELYEDGKRRSVKEYRGDRLVAEELYDRGRRVWRTFHDSGKLSREVRYADDDRTVESEARYDQQGKRLPD